MTIKYFKFTFNLSSGEYPKDNDTLTLSCFISKEEGEILFSPVKGRDIKRLEKAYNHLTIVVINILDYEEITEKQSKLFPTIRDIKNYDEKQRK